MTAATPLATRHWDRLGNGGLTFTELGFGTGLNLVATVLAWQSAGIAGRFRFTSFEAFPMPAADMEAALSAFPEALAAAGPLLAQRAARRPPAGLHR